MAGAEAFRSTPAGPQEQQDWLGARESIVIRSFAIESPMRRSAQVVASHGESIETLSNLRSKNGKGCNWLYEHFTKLNDQVVENGTRNSSGFSVQGSIILSP